MLCVAVCCCRGVCSCADIVSRVGWAGFRDLELQHLCRAIESFPARHIISCGGGVVETEAARAVLASCRLRIVEVQRTLDDIAKDLQARESQRASAASKSGGDLEEEDGVASDPRRPQYAGGESLQDVWARREPYYAELATHTYFVRAGDSDWETHRNRFGDFLVSSCGVGQDQVEFILHRRCWDTPPVGSQMLCMTYGHIGELVAQRYRPEWTEAERSTFDNNVRTKLHTLTEGVDIIELRADLLQHPVTAASLRHELMSLRWNSPLPLLFTLRSQIEGGSFGGSEAEALALTRVALSSGVDLVDVEHRWLRNEASGIQSAGGWRRLLQRYQGHVILVLSKHYPAATAQPSTADMIAQLHEMAEALPLWGERIVLKLVVHAAERRDAVRLAYAVDEFKLQWRRANEATLSSTILCQNAPIVLGLAMGEAGVLTRVLSDTLTPITHPDLQKLAAPGQRSALQLQAARSAWAPQSEELFYLLGHPIGRSASPVMHNAAFQRSLARPLRHYRLCDTSSIDDVLVRLQHPQTKGGSVTIPFKEAIIPHLSHLSAAAEAIGAVNTVTVVDVGADEREWHGDNTDWLGIALPVAKALRNRRMEQGAASSTQAAVTDRRALVIGAGGTARAAIYAMQQLGYNVTVWNRTPSRAVELASAFKCSVLDTLDAATDAGRGFAAVVSTVPGDAEFKLAPNTLQQGAVVLDVVYGRQPSAMGGATSGSDSAMMPFLQCVDARGCQLITGATMLAYQVRWCTAANKAHPWMI